ncbi:MAG: precorrin-3B synthase [Xanthobacteraceae bacterium]
MTALAKAAPHRRDACPGLSAPMPTGDGLLVRLRPIGTVSVAAFRKLCAAARQHGNSVVEITARGSIQVRGLSAASAPRFADAIASLGIATEDGVPVIANPLAGLDPDELIDAGTLAADLRRALCATSLPRRLAPKVSVAIDGGGALNLEGLSADIRLCAQQANGDVTLDVAVGGDARRAVPLGAVALSNGVEAAIRLLEVMARHGHATRARDVLAAEEIQQFCESISGLLLAARPRESGDPPLPPPLAGEGKGGGLRGNERKTAIDLHSLRDGSYARGIGLAFGHAEAATLERLADAAEAAGARGVRIAPGRTLIAIGLTRESATTFTTGAESLGFIVRAEDPRRHVIACAGAPICASAHIAARAMAPRIAEIAARFLDDSFKIHISGCAKGCALAAPAALTVVGTAAGCALVANGSAGDETFAVVAADQLPAAIVNAAREARHV